ncbi:MAG: DUF2461 domain-containing protein [Prevotellaceae bacterium]|jgi:uncharacterized protein (TIGR02453 family)|nr:DUF2461 domain-containing protein [Prevotellaceae bacterium]
MIQPSTLSFLRLLARNNNRDWFNAHRDDYLAAKADVEQLAAQLAIGINEFDRSIGDLAPDDCMFRIYRDTRFANDKTPYKTNFGAVVQRGGKKTAYACYYVHIEPNNCFLSGGIYMPAPPTLKAIRQSIADSYKEFSKLVKERNFKKYFTAIVPDSKLQRVPAGFDKDSPAAEYLKQRDFYVMRPVSSDELCSPAFLTETLQAFKSLMPLNRFFNEAIDEA